MGTLYRFRISEILRFRTKFHGIKNKPFKGEEVQERYVSYFCIVLFFLFEEYKSRVIIVFFRTFSAERGCYYTFVLTRVCKKLFITEI